MLGVRSLEWFIPFLLLLSHLFPVSFYFEARLPPSSAIVFEHAQMYFL